MTSQTRVMLGRINGLYGVRGWVKVYSYTDPLANILTYTPWQICQQGQWREVIVEDGKEHGKGIVAKLVGYDDRDQSIHLLGADIAIAQTQLHLLEKDEYYWSDLIGLSVINQEGVCFGIVDYLLETGAHDVLVIKGEQERLIPFVLNVFIKAIDLQNRTIQVEWDTDF
ncbi:ribosome maturation factor RimM [Beggiatoa leptomitoformis]|uniref:Ribosome maturation factor RimM n=1 Tax=Beggiatoa leptomitoformis TaxID=288004 RepID=A0A2N9YDL9_9GAMM|nr:ribosome maturation factor RimM [Beggiatoa leptomitoformis]ALG69017.1 ribosome maturation factor RimM [Beggiatoa leptomitoformis]AUI68583.1 ribosome maturation factor RimM [Beggiatoa leptomitoformis]